MSALGECIGECASQLQTNSIANELNCKGVLGIWIIVVLCQQIVVVSVLSFSYQIVYIVCGTLGFSSSIRFLSQ